MHESKGSDRDEDLTRELWTAAQMSAVWKTSNPSNSGHLSEGGGHWVQQVGDVQPFDSSDGWRRRRRE
jgi:hypothetical protein